MSVVPLSGVLLTYGGFQRFERGDGALRSHEGDVIIGAIRAEGASLKKARTTSFIKTAIAIYLFVASAFSLAIHMRSAPVSTPAIDLITFRQTADLNTLLQGFAWPYLLLKSTPPSRRSASASIEAQKFARWRTLLLDSTQAFASIRTKPAYSRGEALKALLDVERALLKSGREIDSALLDSIYPQLGTMFTTTALQATRLRVAALERKDSDSLAKALDYDMQWANWYNFRIGDINAALTKASMAPI